MIENHCSDCLDFDSLHQCCRVRIDNGVPCAYLAVSAETTACKDFNTVSTVQLPWFTRIEDKLARKSL